MISIFGRHWRRIAWFVAGLLSTVLFSFGSLNGQESMIAATPSDSFNRSTVQLGFEQLQPLQSADGLNSGFEEMAASHLERNFYQ